MRFVVLKSLHKRVAELKEHHRFRKRPQSKFHQKIAISMQFFESNLRCCDKILNKGIASTELATLNLPRKMDDVQNDRERKNLKMIKN